MSSATDKRRPLFPAAVTLALAGIAHAAVAQVVTEFRTPTSGSQPLEIASGPGGLWFTEHGANRIGLITPDGHFSEFAVSTSPRGIVVGPDGNLWFTSKGQVSRMTTSGVVTDFLTHVFSLPGDPASITVGPDGRLWFTDADTEGGRIGQATVGGQIAEKYIPSFGADDPAGITSGPDGNLWFTEFGAFGHSRIGRVTPSGILTEFALPGVRGVWAIAAGSDSNLWFTETNANKVGRITTSGDITEFAVSGNPRGITAGPDGHLWFAENTGNKIGRITTRGDVVEFPIPTPNAQPWGISAGPDGNIWFTESGTGQIGRIALLKTCDACHDLSVVDLSVGADDKTRVLRFGAATGRMALDSVDEAGASMRSGPFGSYQGWTARRTAAGSDGLTRVLWTNDDGSGALWLIGPQGNEASYRLGPVAGWTAIDVAASIAGTTHLLWTDADGRIALWRVDNSGNVSTGPAYGPYPGWTAVAIADGQDGLTRVLWNKVDGSAGLSFFGSKGLVASYRFGPVAGWTAVDVAVGADGQARILWAHQDGRMSLWRAGGAGRPTALGPIYAPPPGFTPSRVAAGPDGLTRVLWTGVNGGAVLWFMSADDVFQESILLGPDLGGGIAGAWTGKFDSVDFIDCDSNTLAQASFEQTGSAVVGILDAPENGCGFMGVTFQGTLQGNALAGTLTGGRFQNGKATGTLSGASLEISLTSSCPGAACIPGGQMHLHR